MRTLLWWLGAVATSLVWVMSGIQDPLPEPLADGLLGARVLLRDPKIGFFEDSERRVPGDICAVYRVEESEHGRLRVVSSKDEGWVLSNEVIPIDRGLEALTPLT